MLGVAKLLHDFTGTITIVFLELKVDDEAIHTVQTIHFDGLPVVKGETHDHTFLSQQN